MRPGSSRDLAREVETVETGRSTLGMLVELNASRATQRASCLGRHRDWSERTDHDYTITTNRRTSQGHLWTSAKKSADVFGHLAITAFPGWRGA